LEEEDKLPYQWKSDMGWVSWYNFRRKNINDYQWKTKNQPRVNSKPQTNKHMTSIIVVRRSTRKMNYFFYLNIITSRKTHSWIWNTWKHIQHQKHDKSQLSKQTFSACIKIHKKSQSFPTTRENPSLTSRTIHLPS